MSSAHAGLQKHYPDDKRRVAVLTPYKAQMRKLRSVFAASVAAVQMANLEFATVDGFQVRCAPSIAVRTSRWQALAHQQQMPCIVSLAGSQVALF